METLCLPSVNINPAEWREARRFLTDPPAWASLHPQGGKKPSFSSQTWIIGSHPFPLSNVGNDNPWNIANHIEKTCWTIFWRQSSALCGKASIFAFDPLFVPPFHCSQSAVNNSRGSRPSSGLEIHRNSGSVHFGSFFEGPQFHSSFSMCLKAIPKSCTAAVYHCLSRCASTGKICNLQCMQWICLTIGVTHSNHWFLIFLPKWQFVSFRPILPAKSHQKSYENPTKNPASIGMGWPGRCPPGLHPSRPEATPQVKMGHVLSVEIDDSSTSSPIFAANKH